MTEVPEVDHVTLNRAHWNADAPSWVAMGERAWAQAAPTWGVWGVPEADVGMLPDDLDGARTIELGCGTGYVSSWLARRGARAVGVDISEGQLATARRLRDEHALDVALVQASAEVTPFPDASFDFAISEYGAAIWCDPHVWIPEAARLLRPGGRLAFFGNAPLVTCCYPADGSMPPTDRLVRDYFGLHRLDWSDVEVDPGGVEFNLGVSAWFRLFGECGFGVDDYVEVQAPADAQGERFGVTADWARRFPAEHAWKVTKLV